MKTNKSYLKRIRVTRTGKMLVRKPGQDHFNAKQSGNERRSKHGTVSLTLSARTRRRFLPGSGAK